MSVGFENEFPETVGLSAAKSGFGLIEAAFLPAPRLIGPASLWPVAISFFGGGSDSGGHYDGGRGFAATCEQRRLSNRGW